MDFRRLQYFTAVAEELHFGRAAKRLHIAQPPLSRQIQMLEAELGFPLFDRSRRKVELTPAGEVLLNHARRVFESLDVAVREARRASSGETGRVAVGYLSSLAYSGLTELLRAFRARSPDVDLSLRELPPAEQLAAVKDGQLDVGFVRAPLVDDALASEVVRREALLVAVRKDHPLATCRRIRLAKLAREPFVFFPRRRSPAYFDQLMGLFHEAGFVPRIVTEAPQIDVLSLVAAGFGVSIVPAAMRSVRRDDLAFLPIVGAPRSTLLVAWRSGPVSPALQGFLDTVRESRPTLRRGVSS